MQSWSPVIPDNQLKQKSIKPLSPKKNRLARLRSIIEAKYPHMKFKMFKNGEIYIISDSQLAEEMKNWKSPHNELWNYANQLSSRQTRLNKLIKEGKIG